MTQLIYRNATAVLGNLTYAYDPAGNRTAVGGSFARTLLPDAIPSATYDAGNRQRAFGGKTMSYDVNGNLTSITDASGITTLTWDARNRLVALSGPGVTASFAYDSLGRRLSKTINGQPTQYLYDGLDVIQQLDALGTTSYLRSLNIDEALSFTNRTGAFFSIYDPLGSTLAVTDATGTSVVQYTYDPFGTTSPTDLTFPNPFQFTGREHDSTALHYYRARYYSPLLRRFISEDPVGVQGGLNFYAYVENNPVRFVDPLGWWSPGLHDDLTRRVMQEAGGFSRHDIEVAARANAHMDTRDPLSWFNPRDVRHYMPGTEAQAQQFIQQQLIEAVIRDLAGDREGAMRAIGQALHTVQDRSAHAAANPPGTLWRHILGRLKLAPNPDNNRDNPLGWAQAREDTERFLRDFRFARGVKGFK